MGLIDLLTGNAGNQVASEAENKFGINKNQIIALLAVSAPLIISYLRNKSKDAKEAAALNNALDKDHDGSILNNPAQAAARQQEGDSILSHIFGGQKSDVENHLSQSTGIPLQKIGPILAMLAPLVMGYIGKEKRDNNVQSSGMGDLLSNILGGATQQAQAHNSPLNDILGSVLGGSKAGDNPLASILGGVLGGGNPQGKSSNPLGSILGGLFGGK